MPNFFLSRDKSIQKIKFEGDGQVQGMNGQDSALAFETPQISSRESARFRMSSGDAVSGPLTSSMNGFAQSMSIKRPSVPARKFKQNKPGSDNIKGHVRKDSNGSVSLPLLIKDATPLKTERRIHQNKRIIIDQIN